ncbi:MAG: cyclic nucleotide-binding domain-containing protein [Phycisphaerales bacterium]
MGKAMPLAQFKGDALSPEELSEIDIFADIDERSLLKYPGTVRRREFEEGEVICRQGEGGTTAFYILSGNAKIFIRRPFDAGDLHKRNGIVAKIGEIFGQRKLSPVRKHIAGALVPVDASVDLEYGTLTAQMTEGDVFGEMSCLDLAPRSATVVASEPCVMLEILRNMYEVLQKSKIFKAKMDAIYRHRALETHLRNVWLFQTLDDDAIEALCETADLLSLPAGDEIFAEGDEPNGLYLIRRGQVRVAKQFPGGERRLAYLTKGDCFGEIALLRNETRSASCSAADHPIVEGGRKRRPANVELVMISKENFNRCIDRFPDVREKLESLAQQRLLEQEVARYEITPIAHSEEVENLGLLQGQNLMMIDLEKCTRCDQCAQACASAHEDNLSRLIRFGPNFDGHLVPASCRMCRDPVCMIGCPVGSIRKGKDLNIIIEDWCVGCGVCSKQCPYNSIQMHPLENIGATAQERAKRVAESGEVVEVTDRAVVCDQCASLPTGPACVYACPHDAAMRVDAAVFLGATAKEKAGKG